MRDMVPEKITAIIRGYEGERLDRIVSALADGGIKSMEVTMNSPSAAASITRLIRMYGGRLKIGAGTVTSMERFLLVADAGAQFIITPNVDEEIIKASHERGLMIIPGVYTPSEIVKAESLGCGFVKLFPAVSVGPEYIKAVKAPLNQIEIIVVGGITTDNVTEYLKCGAYGAGVGGSLCRIPEDGDCTKITKEAKKMVGLVYRDSGTI